MTQPTLSPADAYALAFLPAASVVPLANYGVLESVTVPPSEEKLAHALKFSRGAIKITEARASEAHQRLIATAARGSVSLAERPTTAADWKTWLDAVRARSEPAVGDTSRAAFATGVAAGDVLLTMWMGRNLIYLRTAAPEHAFLRQCAEELARSLAERMRQLTALLGQLKFTGSGAVIPRKLPVLLASAPDLLGSTTTDAFKKYFDWATQVSALLDDLGPALQA